MYEGNLQNAARGLDQGDAAQESSPSRMDSAINDVSRMVDEMESLLGRIAGPRPTNSANKGSTEIRAMPTLASLLSGGPDRIRGEVKRGAEIMQQIRVALGI